MKSKENPFLFEKPYTGEQYSRGATIAIFMGAIASRLAREEREDVEQVDGRRENVAEHALMLAKVAPELAHHFYPHLDINLVARFSTIHDDPEAYVGDTSTRTISPADMIAKIQREEAGTQQLLEDYAFIPLYAQLVRDYEDQVIAEARFVRLVDKLTVQLVHFPNNAKVLRRLYNRNELLEAGRVRAAKLLEQFPEFPEIIALRIELDQLLVDEFFEAQHD